MGGTYSPDVDAGHEVIDVTSMGGGISLLSSKKINFTVDKANWMLQEVEEFIGDRDLRESHVNYLVEAMKRGTFRTELVSLAICEFKGKQVRINGQHTCWARITVGSEWAPPTQVNLLEYKAETEADLRLLYSTFDRGAARSKGHVTLAHLQGTKEFEGIKLATLKRLPAGLAFWLWENSSERSRHDGDAIATLLKTEHRDLSTKVSKFLDGLAASDARHLLRGPVIAALFGTFKNAPRKAEEFWKGIATGVGFGDREDPRNKLRTILLETAVDSGKGKRKSVSGETMFRQCVAAWNAWRRGDQPKYLRAVESQPRPDIGE